MATLILPHGLRGLLHPECKSHGEPGARGMRGGGGRTLEPGLGRGGCGAPSFGAAPSRLPACFRLVVLLPVRQADGPLAHACPGDLLGRSGPRCLRLGEEERRMEAKGCACRCLPRRGGGAPQRLRLPPPCEGAPQGPGPG